MAQEYIIKAVKKGKAWSGSYGNFQDYALALTGIGEPVKISKPEPVLEEPKIGDILYGRLIEEKANDGRVYYKLKTEPRPEEDKRQASIQAQFAINRAVDIWIAGGCDPESYDNILVEAKHFYHMINKVREN